MLRIIEVHQPAPALKFLLFNSLLLQGPCFEYQELWQNPTGDFDLPFPWSWAGASCNLSTFGSLVAWEMVKQRGLLLMAFVRPRSSVLLRLLCFSPMKGLMPLRAPEQFYLRSTDQANKVNKQREKEQTEDTEQVAPRGMILQEKLDNFFFLCKRSHIRSQIQKKSLIFLYL